MRRLLGSLALAGALVMPASAQVMLSSAQAAPFPPRLNFAYDLAIHYWGREPTACSSIDKEIVPRGSLGNPYIGAISGRSTQVAADAPPDSVACELWIDRAYAEPIIFDLLCAVMVHNVGHLLGMEHSPNPADVMNENIPVPPLCSLKGHEAIRIYFLRMRFHRLLARRGTAAEELRRQTQRELSVEARRFRTLG